MGARHWLSKSLLQKSDGSRDPPNRQPEALAMTRIWPPGSARAHLRAVSMCRVTLGTAVDTFASGSSGTPERCWEHGWESAPPSSSNLDHAASAGSPAVGRGPEARLPMASASRRLGASPREIPAIPSGTMRSTGSPAGCATQALSEFLRVAHHRPQPDTVGEGHLGQPARKGSQERGGAQRDPGSGADTGCPDATAQAVPEGSGVVTGLQEPP